MHTQNDVLFETMNSINSIKHDAFSRFPELLFPDFRKVQVLNRGEGQYFSRGQSCYVG